MLVLYWIPSSRDELRSSDLMTSRELAEAAGDCVSLQIIRPEDAERLETLRGSSPLPFAVLTDGNGRELARVDSTKGRLPAGALAALIQDELMARSKEADRLLLDARKRQTAGDWSGAIELCQLVQAGGCTIPRQSKSASKLLRKALGFRILMDVISLDPSLVKGSHGACPADPDEWPVLIGAGRSAEPIDATAVHDRLLGLCLR